MASRCFPKMLQSAKQPLIFGMIHVPALPGSPKGCLSMSKISEIVTKETEIYANANVDGIILENMHDLPYQLTPFIGPEVTSSMTRACLNVNQVLGRDRKKFQLGIQILAGANREAIAVAHAAEFNFIRAEGFVFSHVADEGLINACAGELLRYRKYIDATNIAILADIKKKHSAHSITSDVSILETAKAAEFFLADGVVITGNSTGESASENELKELSLHCSLPVVIGSGITLKNAIKYRLAKAFIIGSYFKAQNKWINELDAQKVREFVKHVKNNL